MVCQVQQSIWLLWRMALQSWDCFPTAQCWCINLNHPLCLSFDFQAPPAPGGQAFALLEVVICCWWERLTRTGTLPFGGRIYLDGCDSTDPTLGCIGTGKLDG